MIPSAALAAALILAAEAPASGDAQPGVRSARRGSGLVSYVTATRAYLDAGAEDGLQAGAEVALRRGAEATGRCRIEVLGPHQAVCAGTSARAGDRFDLPAAAAEAPPPRLLPPPPGGEVMARRLEVLEAAPVPKVAFQASAPAPEILPRARAIDLAISHRTFDVSPGGASNKESVDVLARGVPLASWLFLDLDARAEHWLSRENPRFRPRDKSQLYVWQAQLTAVPADALSVSAGRILPWGVPGATVLDGAMCGWHGRLGETTAEAGLFGGEVPRPDTLQPTGNRSTGGAYWILDRRLSEAVLRTEGRLAAVTTPELGTRGEASLTGRWFARALDLSAEASLGAGGKAHAQGYLDAARLDAAWRPQAGTILGGSFRYAGLTWPQPFDPAAFPGHTREADGFVGHDLGRWLRVGAVGGYSEDLSSRAARRWIGPEVSLPRLLGRWGTLSAGYLEERGWIGGRSAYGQLVATPWRPVWLLARAGWSHEQVSGPFRDEASLTLAARAELNAWLTARLSLTGRAGLDGGGEGSTTPYGVTAFVSLAAAF